MGKLNLILLTTVVIFLNFLFQVNKAFGQMATEKDILLTEYPIYFDGLRNSMVEAQISDSFITKNNVKLLTQLTRYKTNNLDTILPLQRIFYDKSGRINKQEIFYYGQLSKTRHFSYTKNEMTVYEESLENRNRNELLYKIQFDSFDNPIKYIRYQVYNHEGGLDGLDSVAYVYTYDKKGDILVKKQHFYYRELDEGGYSDLIFNFKYNKQGQNIGYTVSNNEKQIYSVEKEYTNGLLHKRNATYNFYDDLKKYYDSTEYFYGEDLKLSLIKRTYFHNPLRSQPDEILIQFLYDKNGFLSEEYPLVFKEKSLTFYKWEFYD